MLALFIGAFLAATLFPAQSELMLAVMCRKGEYSPVWLVAVAGLGNELGSVTNWLLGRYGASYLAGRAHATRRAKTPSRIACTAGLYYRRYGAWTLLLSWAPVIGDPLTLAAGIAGTPFRTFLPIVTFAKYARYAVIAVAATP